MTSKAKPRSVLISGGTGALGAALVLRFLEAGDRVTVPWIFEAERESLAQRHKAELDEGRLRLVGADIATAEGAGQVVETAGSLQILVNAAGGFGGGDPVHEAPLALWDQMWRINVLTAVALTRAAVPELTRAEGAAIVNVASRAAVETPPGLAAYSASKAAVSVLTQTTARELESAGIRVNAVVPTTIDTPANRQAMPEADFSSWTTPERIADVVHWLAGPDAAAVSGGLIPV